MPSRLQTKIRRCVDATRHQICTRLQPLSLMLDDMVQLEVGHMPTVREKELVARTEDCGGKRCSIVVWRAQHLLVVLMANYLRHLLLEVAAPYVDGVSLCQDEAVASAFKGVW